MVWSPGSHRPHASMVQREMMVLYAIHKWSFAGRQDARCRQQFASSQMVATPPGPIASEGERLREGSPQVSTRPSHRRDRALLALDQLCCSG